MVGQYHQDLGDTSVAGFSLLATVFLILLMVAASLVTDGFRLNLPLPPGHCN